MDPDLQESSIGTKPLPIWLDGRANENRTFGKNDRPRTPIRSCFDKGRTDDVAIYNLRDFIVLVHIHYFTQFEFMLFCENVHRSLITGLELSSDLYCAALQYLLARR